MKAAWDVFLSYPRSDAQTAVSIGRALQHAGLQVFWDDAGVAAFQPISGTIMRELNQAKVVLAYYSRAYVTRRACQHELTAAFLAGQHEGDPRRRVLVINPEIATDHIHPIELRDTRHAPSITTSPEELAEAVATHVAAIHGTIGEVRAPSGVPWFPAPGRANSSPFTGRLPDLWRLHSALQQHQAPLTSNSGGQLAVVHGMTGTGKSRLALEYAHRFQSCYRGGICWLTADLDDPLQSLRAQHAEILLAMRSAPGSFTAARSQGAQTQDPPPTLWILDNVPPGLAITEFAGLLGPYRHIHTVITTTDRRYGQLGSIVGLGRLPHEDAVSLLRTAWSNPSTAILNTIVDRLDRHTEALTVTAGHSDPVTALSDLAWGPAPMAALAHRILREVHRAHAQHDAAGVTHDTLRAIATLEPAPVSTDHLTTFIASLHHLKPPSARRAIDSALTRLDDLDLLESTARHSITISPLLGYLIRTFEPDPHRHAEIRSLALATLPTEPSLGGGHSRSRLQRTAWALQVELDHRLAVLDQPEHGLRGTLAQLYTLVDFIRALLTDSGPDPSLQPIHQICITLLTEHLRPTLTLWHPTLLNHELNRPSATTPTTHERNWPHAHALRAVLTSLRDPITATLQHLSAITGNNHGLPLHPQP